MDVGAVSSALSSYFRGMHEIREHSGRTWLGMLLEWMGVKVPEGVLTIPQTMKPDAIERRGAIRLHTLGGGRISFHYLSASINCVIRDLSETGACLVVESPVGMPETFELCFNDEDAYRKCRVIWRSTNMLGVAFE